LIKIAKEQSPNAAYKMAMSETKGIEDLAEACRFLAVIKREFGSEEFENAVKECTLSSIICLHTMEAGSFFLSFAYKNLEDEERRIKTMIDETIGLINIMEIDRKCLPAVSRINSLLKQLEDYFFQDSRPNERKQIKEAVSSIFLDRKAAESLKFSKDEVRKAVEESLDTILGLHSDIPGVNESFKLFKIVSLDKNVGLDSIKMNVDQKEMGFDLKRMFYALISILKTLIEE